MEGGGGNNEFQYYTNNRTNSFVKNGILYLYPTFTRDRFGSAFEHDNFELNLYGNEPANHCTGMAFEGCIRRNNLTANIMVNPIQSALIRSHKFSFKYGRVQFRARIPKGDWLWPAVWMLPKDQQYGSWPASGEIDILESRGNELINIEGLSNQGKLKASRQYAASTLHWGPSYEYNKYELTTNGTILPNSDLNTEEIYNEELNYSVDSDSDNDFHVYTLDWTQNGIKTYVDNKPIFNLTFNKNGFYKLGNFKNLNDPWQASKNYKAAPFDQDFYLIINLAVGGTNNFFNDKIVNKPWKNSDGKQALFNFWSNREKWLNTWKSDLSRAFAIDYVKVWKYC